MDGIVGSVGTANVDMRSFEENFEVNLIVYDRNVAKNLATYFMEDLRIAKKKACIVGSSGPDGRKFRNRLPVCLPLCCDRKRQPVAPC